MAGQINYITSLVVIFIFAIAIINFGVNYATEQNTEISIANDPDIVDSITNSNSAMTTFVVVSNSSETAFVESSIEETSQSGTLVTGSLFKSTYTNPFKVLKSMMGLGYKKIFGADSSFTIVFNTLIGLIIIIGFYLAWKTWKGGNPE